MVAVSLFRAAIHYRSLQRKHTLACSGHHARAPLCSLDSPANPRLFLKREVIVGNAGRLLALQHALSLGLYERQAARQIDKDHFQDEPASSTSGNLFEPVAEGSEVSGGWKNADGTVSARRMALGGAAAAAAGAGLLGWRRLRRN